MRLFLRVPTSGTLSLDVSPNATVHEVKREINVVFGVHPTEQKLAYASEPLEDDCLLQEFNISEYDCLDLNCELLGGAKKRKKKVYTTPKKIKHKKKKVKLSTLKFYKVDSNGKITRLRRECPNEKCGAGVFMASHFDRQYCGKCALTYMHERK